MRNVIGIAAIISIIICFLVATLYLLRRLKPVAIRLLVAFLAGLLTDLLVRVVIRVGYLSEADWTSFVAWAYQDFFGIRSAAVRLFYPDYYFPSADAVLPDHPTVELIVDFLPIVLWTCIFTVVYFLRVRRTPQTI
ncbi:MAG TPA: hypothetical protein VK581_00995 [Chthoniobacterales bacterium]|nr:hypothetical protein [Chthoniobacterales bacterium]